MSVRMIAYNSEVGLGAIQKPVTPPASWSTH